MAHPPAQSGSSARCVVTLGYTGAAFRGLAHTSDGGRFVEADVVAALRDCGAECGAEEAGTEQVLQGLQWRRAVRTEPGVGAHCNVFSLRLEEEAAARAEAGLAQSGRRIGGEDMALRIQRAAPGFNAERACGGCAYEVILPTYALLPAAAFEELFPAPGPDHPEAMVNPKRPRGEGGAEGGEWAFRALAPALVQRLRAYRCAAATVARFRMALQHFVGTAEGSPQPGRLFHNYTPKGRADAKGARRLVHSITVGDPSVRQVATGATAVDIEAVVVVVHGVSFAPQQVRKMVGAAAAALVAGLDGGEFLPDTLKAEGRVPAPMVPASCVALASVSVGLDLPDLGFAERTRVAALAAEVERLDVVRWMSWLRTVLHRLWECGPATGPTSP